MAQNNGQVATSGGGIGLSGAFLLLFVGLKLGGAIDWSWWWVLSPLWIPIALVFGIWVIGVVFILLVQALGRK